MKNDIREVIGLNNELKRDVENYLNQLSREKIEISNSYLKKSDEFINNFDIEDDNFKSNFKKYGEYISNYLFKSVEKYVKEIYKGGFGLAAWHNLYSISELVDSLKDVYSATVDDISYDFSKESGDSEEESVENVQEASNEEKAKVLLTKYSEDFKYNIKTYNENLINSTNIENKDEAVELLNKYIKEVLNRNFTTKVSASKDDSKFNAENLKKFEIELGRYEDFKTRYSNVVISKFEKFDLLSSLSNEKDLEKIESELSKQIDKDEVKFYIRFILWTRNRNEGIWKQNWEKSKENNIKTSVKPIKEQDEVNDSSIQTKIYNYYLSTKNKNLEEYGKNISSFLVEIKKEFLEKVTEFVKNNSKAIDLDKAFKGYINLLQVSLEDDISSLKEEVNPEIRKIYYEILHKFINQINSYNKNLSNKIGEEEYNKIKQNLGKYLFEALNILGGSKVSNVEPKSEEGNVIPKYVYNFLWSYLLWTKGNDHWKNIRLAELEDKKEISGNNIIKIGKESLLQFVDVYNKTYKHDFDLKKYMGNMLTIINRKSFPYIKSSSQIPVLVRSEISKKEIPAKENIKIGKESLFQFVNIYNKKNRHFYDLKTYFGTMINLIGRSLFPNIKSRVEIQRLVQADFPDLYKTIPNYVYYFLWSYLLWTRNDDNWVNIRLSESKIKNLREIILNIMKEEKSKKDKKLFGINRTLGYLLSVADSPKALYNEISQAEPLLNKKIILSLVKALAKIKKIKDGKAPNNPS